MYIYSVVCKVCFLFMSCHFSGGYFRSIELLIFKIPWIRDCTFVLCSTSVHLCCIVTVYCVYITRARAPSPLHTDTRPQQPWSGSCWPWGRGKQCADGSTPSCSDGSQPVFDGDRWRLQYCALKKYLIRKIYLATQLVNDQWVKSITPKNWQEHSPLPGWWQAQPLCWRQHPHRRQTRRPARGQVPQGAADLLWRLHPHLRRGQSHAPLRWRHQAQV